jgi:hypothetical protein
MTPRIAAARLAVPGPLAALVQAGHRKSSRASWPLAVFAHRVEGSSAAAGVLRGLSAGLFGFTVFFFALAMLLEPTGIGWAFASATAGMLLVHAVSLVIIRRPLEPRWEPTGGRR